VFECPTPRRIHIGPVETCVLRLGHAEMKHRLLGRQHSVLPVEGGACGSLHFQRGVVERREHRVLFVRERFVTVTETDDRKYLTTDPNKTTTNQLLFLPRCP
jgi:hypothetical protein